MTISKIIVTADDLGISEGVNDGILESYERGIVTRCSLLANGNAFNHAVRDTLEKNKTMPVGVHLNIMFGKPLHISCREIVSSKGIMEPSYWRLLWLFYFNSNKRLLNEVKDEFKLQVDKVAKAIGRPVNHLDSQSHIHNIPPIFDVVCQVAEKVGCLSIRICKEIPMVRFLYDNVNPKDALRAGILLTLALQCKRKNFDCPQHIFGMYQSGRVNSDSIRHFVSKSLQGKSEICVHPGYHGFHNGEKLYEQEWVNKWINSSNRFLELKAITAWSKSNFESEFKVELCP